ncbi:hypothetical protein [Streptomyces sp. NPDC090445]|uniref:hypothetical protein n=1 Tax=Streptomyces sp. NPDC090445 TaxID=3365963 RepID=UPI0037F12F8C
MTENAPVNGPIGAELRHQVRADEYGVQDVTAPPRRSELDTRPGVPGAGRGQVLRHLRFA